MPPHCDSMDGPVVTAARRALEKADVNLILPYVKESATGDVKSAFEKALQTRKLNAAAREVADLYFYETAVRLHRAGEGAPYTGLKPAGLDVGPVTPLHHDTLYHLGIEVADKDAVIVAYRRAPAFGATIEKPPRTTWKGTPLHELWLKDPDGNLIEIYARLTDRELATRPAAQAAVFLVAGTEP